VSKLKRKVKIAVLDDEPHLLGVMANILENKEYSVIKFQNPIKALEKLKKVKVDLIVTDIDMPYMNGVQFLYRIKELYPSMPVIFHSAQCSSEVVLQAVRGGVFDYLAKPCDINRIYEVVERALNSSTRAA